MSFELPKYESVAEPDMKAAAEELGIKYLGTGSAILWLTRCVKAIESHLSDLDDDVDALWAVSLGDVPLPPDFCGEDFPPAVHEMFCAKSSSNVTSAPPAIINTFPDGEHITGSNALKDNGKDRLFFSTNLNLYELIDAKLVKITLANA